MQENEWIIQGIDKTLLSNLKEQTKLPETVLKVLINRGFKDVESVEEFVFPKKEILFNPFLFKDMHKSVVRIHQAIENQEKILIYADRDVDGITALSVLYNTIITLGGKVCWYIPSDEGYGLSCNVLDKYSDEGIKLIITVDCGISAVKEIDYANNLGIEVIVTDHHEPPQDGLPKAYCIVNPKINTDVYPFSDLAGCGVSFKVSQALMQTYGKYFDKKIAVIAIENGKCFFITLVNNIIVGEQEFMIESLSQINLYEYSKIN